MNIEGIDQQRLKQAYQAIKEINIPSLPKTLLALQQELNREEPDQRKIIRLIGEDISLSGKIIQNINSAAFGLKVEVTSIEHATIILGIRNLRDMIVATTLRKALEDSLPDFTTISEYSNKVGIVARTIATDCGRPDPESAFIVGLFHKAGTMLLMQKFDRYLQIHNQCQHDPNELLRKELELFGSSYPMVSFILAYHWKLPALAAQSIAFHLTKLSLIEDPAVRPLVATLQIAIYLTAVRSNSFTESESSAAMKQEAMQEINIDDTALLELSRKITAE